MLTKPHHRNVEYRVRRSPNKGNWIWTIFPRGGPLASAHRGEALDEKLATEAAKKAIDEWLKDYPVDEEVR